eukprot:g39732.t1
MEVSEDEEEEQEEQEQEQKEDEKEQKVEEENDDDEEGGDDEGPPVYNPSPYTPLQTVDPSSDRPRHKARSTMDQKFDIDPTLHFMHFFPTEMLPSILNLTSVELCKDPTPRMRYPMTVQGDKVKKKVEAGDAFPESKVNFTEYYCATCGPNMPLCNSKGLFTPPLTLIQPRRIITVTGLPLFRYFFALTDRIDKFSTLTSHECSAKAPFLSRQETGGGTKNMSIISPHLNLHPKMPKIKRTCRTLKTTINISEQEKEESRRRRKEQEEEKEEEQEQKASRDALLLSQSGRQLLLPFLIVPANLAHGLGRERC